MTEADLRRAFDTHKDAVYDFALRMTASPAMAEDVAQDCFLELIRKPGAFNAARGTLRVFLIGIARHLVYRRWRVEQRYAPDELLESALPAVLPDPDSAGVAEMVRQAVQSLPPLQREAVVLFEYEGCSLEEIAQLANADIGTIKSRLHRARHNLRQVLAPLRDGVQK